MLGMAWYQVEKREDDDAKLIFFDVLGQKWGLTASTPLSWESATVSGFLFFIELQASGFPVSF